jgi:hypothetical protein
MHKPITNSLEIIEMVATLPTGQMKICPNTNLKESRFNEYS